MSTRLTKHKALEDNTKATWTQYAAAVFVLLVLTDLAVTLAIVTEEPIKQLVQQSRWSLLGIVPLILGLGGWGVLLAGELVWRIFHGKA